MDIRALATDYDGTIAHNGAVDADTLKALQRFKDSGRKLLLVTGREIPDLESVFTELPIFDLIVAENGALLYWPLAKKEKLLAEPPPSAFADLLRRRAVNMLSVGKVIVATLENYESIVREAIAEMRLPLEIILNKGSVMILPRGVDKGSGLIAALAELGLTRAQIAAIGDAENDHSLLRNSGYKGAVSNALVELKAAADFVATRDHGSGVAEFIENILGTDSRRT